MVRKKGAAAGASKAAKSAKKAKAAKKTEQKEKKRKVHADSDLDSDDDLEATLDKVCFFLAMAMEEFLHINDRCGGNGRKLMQSLKRQSRVRPAAGRTR